MKQLLIVNSGKALNAGKNSGTVTPYDLSALDVGAITFFELGASSLLAAAPKKNFAIALGRANNSPAFVIPEVDVDTLSITKALPKKGVAFSASVTIPTVSPGGIYTLVLVKNGTVPHERNTWTATESVMIGDTSQSASTIAAKLRAYFTNMAATGSLNVTVSGTGAVVTITGNTVGEGWTLKCADDLMGTTVTTTAAEPNIGDAAYIKQLASMCAAGKGFTDTEISGRDVYPGYPEAVEDVALNTSGTGGASTAGYAVYTLRFQVGRASAKTRDEKVWQLVHIAVPITASSYSSIDTILPEGKFVVSTTSSSSSSNSGTTTG